jgi:hypothetical protein
VFQPGDVGLFGPQTHAISELLLGQPELLASVPDEGAEGRPHRITS